LIQSESTKERVKALKNHPTLTNFKYVVALSCALCEAHLLTVGGQ